MWNNICSRKCSNNFVSIMFCKSRTSSQRLWLWTLTSLFYHFLFCRDFTNINYCHNIISVQHIVRKVCAKWHYKKELK